MINPQRSLRRPRSASDDDARVMPLINVVFLLLIFFMLAGRFNSLDPFEVEPPRSASEQPPVAQTLEVLVAADGRLAIEGHMVAADDLGATLRNRLDEQPTSRIRLRADGGADTSEIVALMERLREMGIESLQLLTLTEID